MEPGDSDWKASEFARLLATLERERRYYQEILGLVPAGIVVINKHRELRWTNRAFRQRFQLRPDEVKGRKFSEFLPSPQIEDRIRDVFESGAPARALALRALIENVPRELQFRMIPLRDWEDDIEDQVLIVIDDYTDLPRVSAVESPAAPATAAPAEPTPQPPSAVPAIPAGLPCVTWTASKSDQRFLSVSANAESVLGFPIEHWTKIRTFWAARLLEEDRAATLAFYDEAIQMGGVHSAEFRVRNAKGEIRWLREIVHVGDVLSGLFIDVTNRRLLDQQYIDTQRFDSVANFAGDVAHSINNHLTVVAGYSEMLASITEEDDPARSDLQAILDKTVEIKGVTDRMSMVARRERRNPVAVNVAETMVALVRRIRAAKGPEIEFDEPKAATWAMAEVEHLRTAVLELAATVIEGSAQPTRLRLSLERTQQRDLSGYPDTALPPGAYVRIVIEDLNPDPDKHPQFRPLENLFPRRSSGRDPSTGLIRAFQLIREWGGLCWVSPEGQTGHLMLAEASGPVTGSEEAATASKPSPARPAPAAAGPRLVDPLAKSSEPGMTLPGATPSGAAAIEPEPVRTPRAQVVALVEDEPGIRAMMRKILQRRNYEVIEAGSGEEGLRLVEQREGKVDLLITDVVMPGMNGRELAERIVSRYPDIAVLYVSGFTQATGVETGKFPPGSSFLQKPFSLDTLVNTVADVLSRKRAQ